VKRDIKGEAADAGESALSGGPQGLVLSSGRLGWEHVSLTHWEAVAPQEAEEDALTRHLIVIHLTPEPVGVLEKGDGLHAEGLARPGDINLFSAGERSYCRWERALSFLRLDLSPDYLQQVALQAEMPGLGTGSGNIELNRRLRMHDAKLLQLSQWLADAARQPGFGGRLYTDSLLNLLTFHLLEQYASAGVRRPANAQGRMTPSQIANALEYVEAHLERDISLDELASAAMLSPSHLTRLFKQETGMTPHQYVVYRRVEHAKSLIRTRSFTMSEIAAALGFADQSHMNRHFKRLTGMTPKEFERG
jgi:AraC family transcriptional regulator